MKRASSTISSVRSRGSAPARVRRAGRGRRGWSCDGCGRHWAIRDGIPGSFRPTSCGSSVRPPRRSAGNGSTSPRCTPSSRPSSSIGSIRSDREFFKASGFSTPAAERAARVLAARYGAREVVALDLSGAVEAARVNLAATRQRPRRAGRPPPPPVPYRGSRRRASTSSTRSASSTTSPIRTRGSATLLRYLRPGGTIAVWVYGYENNGFVRNVVEPPASLTRIPPPILRGLAWPLAVGFHGWRRGCTGR